MSDTAAVEQTSTDEGLTPTDLLDSLRELGLALPVNFQPNAHDHAALTAGLVYYLATGSLVPPKVETPDEAAAKQELADTTALNEEKAKVAELERKLAAAGAVASPVAPEPVAPVAVEPVPTPPVETPPTVTPVDPPAATPINADVPAAAPVGDPAA